MNHHASVLPIVLIVGLTAADTHATLVTVNDVYTPNAPVFNVPSSTGVLANDSSTVGGLQAVSFFPPAGGTVSLFTDGSFTFTPNAGLATNTSWTYTATDNSGATSSATVTFDMESTLPQAVDDSYTPDATTFSIAAPQGLLANDTGGIGGVQAVSFFPPVGGTVSLLTDGSFTFTPNSGLATDTAFTYSISDGLGRTSSATVTFDMVSTLPQAVNDTYTPDATTFSIAAPQGLLANDTGGIGGVQAVSFFPPAGGTVSLFTDGSFTFTPNSGLATDTTFTYSISDGLGRTSSATVTFDMVSTLPQAVNDTYTMLAGDVLTVGPLGLLANDTGGIGSLQVVSFFDTADGLLNIFTDGSFMFTPDLGFSGITHFDYWISDALGRQSDASVWIEVLPSAVPEPTALALFGLGLAGMGAMRRKKLTA